MATVYDLVQHVKPGTVTSCRPGSWLIGSFADEARAQWTCDLCNQNLNVEGLSYTVESHDESSPDRRRYLSDMVRDEKIPEGWQAVRLRLIPTAQGIVYDRFRCGWRRRDINCVMTESGMNIHYRNGTVSRLEP